MECLWSGFSRKLTTSYWHHTVHVKMLSAKCYGVPFVIIFNKIDRIITASHCTYENVVYKMVPFSPALAVFSVRTVQCGQNLHIGPPEYGQGLFMNVNVRQVRDEVVTHQKPHQHPVINDVLQVVLERQRLLKRQKITDVFRYCNFLLCS